MVYRYVPQQLACRCWIGAGVGVLLILLTLPPNALGQPASLSSLFERGQQTGANVELMRTVADRAGESGLSPEATTELLEPALALAERDLPSGPVLNKALEGLSKRVPPERMTSVLQQLRTRTEQAGQLVAAWLQQDEVRTMIGADADASPGRGRPDLIASVADAQQQKVPADAIKAFLNELPATTERRPVSLSDVSVAVGVLPDLPSNGESPAAARQLLVAALDAGYDPESMRQLPAAIEQAQRQTQRPTAAIAKGAAQAISWGTPADNVLRNLFRGAPPAGPPARTGEGNQGQNAPPDDPPENGPPDNPPGGGSGGDGGS